MWRRAAPGVTGRADVKGISRSGRSARLRPSDEHSPGRASANQVSDPTLGPVQRSAPSVARLGFDGLSPQPERPRERLRLPSIDLAGSVESEHSALSPVVALEVARGLPRSRDPVIDGGPGEPPGSLPAHLRTHDTLRH